VHAFAAGDVLAGRFRILRFIAQGGMGEVYEAEDLELKEEVALKTIRADVAGDARSLERFKNEIHLARRVTHPNACRIFDVFHHRPSEGEETVFLTMELLRGETLAERVRGAGRLSPEEALPLVRQIVAGLEAAHHAGVIHRDLKSANVILVPEADRDGALRAVVTDFGLARRSSREESRSATVSGDLAGTPAYMAPEQIEGGQATAASDVYALGVVMFEMVTGERPFAGDSSLSVLVKRLKEPPRSPRQLVPQLDRRWERVILRCLERDPGERFASAGDVARALAGEEVAPATARARRRLLLLATAGALVLTLAGAGVALRLVRGRPTESARFAPARARPAVAVLGFKNLSGRPEAAWLSTAVAEMLGSELAAGERLRIVPGENVARMMAELAIAATDSLAPDTLARVRGHLGADLLVLGSYTVLGGRIRLDLRLQDAAAGETLTSVAETGTEAELFELVSRSGVRLCEKLGAAPPTAAESRSARASMPSNPEAARLYAEGLKHLREFDALAARALLEKAAAADPQHAPTHSALAGAWSALGYEARAREESKKAFDLAGALSREERLAVEARYREATHDWDKAVDIYRSLLQFFPDNLEYGLRLASAQESAGKGKDALATLDALRALPPPAGEDPRIDLTEATTARYLSETKRAVEAARRAAQKATARGARHLLARARFEEGSSLQNLGEYDAARAALEEGRGLFAAAGDRYGVAGSLNNISIILANRGDLEGAGRFCREALELYRAIGNRSGEALMRSSLGNIQYFKGDLTGARAVWEETLVVYREINHKEGVARMLTNIASAMAEQGSISAARRRFEEALVVWREIGHQSGIGVTLLNVANALDQEGDLARAEEVFQESLAVLQRTGDKTYAAGAHQAYGNLRLEKGDRAGARLHYERALAMREAMGEAGAATETRLALAGLALEEGRPPQAEAMGRAAAEQAAKEKNVDNEAAAHMVIARARLAQGRAEEAREAAGRAAALVARSEKLALRATLTLVEARLRAAGGAPADLQAARRSLRGLLSKGGEQLPLALQLEARLALAEVAARGKEKAARAELQALAQECRTRGFELLAAKAEAALE
jgi:tetratricopeptide (TPR) repeat protein/tRNA A-37 threonylcarbamoyl transferase component Bud32